LDYIRKAVELSFGFTAKSEDFSHTVISLLLLNGGKIEKGSLGKICLFFFGDVPSYLILPIINM